MNYIASDRNSMYFPMEERMNKDNPFSSLMLIDVMATELCNRDCVFCPRGYGYPNLNLHMDLEIVEKVARDLANSHYENRILYCGFGESLLYKHLIESIKIFKEHMPWQENIHIVTNGDKLDYNMIMKLLDAGINKFFVSLYDGIEQVHHFEKLFCSAGVKHDQYILQKYYKSEEEQFGFLHLSNRAGYLFSEKLDLGCNVPFYAMSLHYNGDVLLCSHDWEKKQIMGNVMNDTVQNIWLESQKLWSFRKALKKNRNCYPCNKCNIKGILYGNKSKEILM